MTLSYLTIGFVAAALAVVFAHQVIVLILNFAGVWPAQPYSLKPVGPFNVPTIINSIFWGGLWGVLFALIWDKLPGDAFWLKGLMFGLLVFLLSNCILLPLIKGQPLFYEFDMRKLAIVALILSAFGTATGIFFQLLRQQF